jgi:hypothetical protein
MFAFLKELFSEDNGRASSIRVTMFVIALAACAIAVWSVMHGGLTLEIIGLVSSMLLIGVGAKTISKFAEGK